VAVKYSDAKPNTKRKPGAVRDAIMEMLAYRTLGATVAQITEEVSQRIGPTPPSSVRSYLRLNTPKLFTKIDRGHYVVREEAQATLAFANGAQTDSVRGLQTTKSFASTAARQLKPIVGPDDFAAGCEGDFDQILKSTTYDFHFRTVGSTTQECPGSSFQERPVPPPQAIAIGTAHRQVKQSIGTKCQTVQAPIIRVAETRKDHRPFVGTAITVRVFERHQIGRVGDIQLAIAPDHAHGKHQIVGEYLGVFEPAVAIAMAELSRTSSGAY
jgi:hypothetical protein